MSENVRALSDNHSEHIGGTLLIENDHTRAMYLFNMLMGTFRLQLSGNLLQIN